MARKTIEKCSTGHVLAIARWEDNYESWLEGNYLGLISRKPFLLEKVGQDGTLWIVVSRPKPKKGRLYSISFRINNCDIVTYPRAGKFGRYAVMGDPNRSQVFAANDAKYLLLSLRFDPYLPIKEPELIGQSIQTPRCLNEDDIQLLEEYGAASDRWSVFISYQNRDTQKAKRLSNTLIQYGVNVFRDKEALRGGEKWWPALKHAIRRSRYLVVLLGIDTHKSTWVKREIQVAEENSVRVIPILAGADTKKWKGLLDRHALSLQADKWTVVVDKLLDAIGSPINSTQV